MPRTPLEIRFLRSEGSDGSPLAKPNVAEESEPTLLSSVLGRLEAPPPPSNAEAAAAIAAHAGSQPAIDSPPTHKVDIDPALLLKPVAVAAADKSSVFGGPGHSRGSSSGSFGSSLSGWFNSPPRNAKMQSDFGGRGAFDKSGEKSVVDHDAQLILEERMFEVLHEQKTVNVLVALMPDDEQNLMVLRGAAAVWTQLGRSNMLKVIVKVVDDDSKNGTDWVRQYKTFLASDDRGDAVDVVVIKPAEATAKLLQLATFGKLPGLQSPSASKNQAPKHGIGVGVEENGSVNPIHHLPPRQLRYDKRKTKHQRSHSEPSWLPEAGAGGGGSNQVQDSKPKPEPEQIGKRGVSGSRRSRTASRGASRFSPCFTPKAGDPE